MAHTIEAVDELFVVGVKVSPLTKPQFAHVRLNAQKAELFEELVFSFETPNFVADTNAQVKETQAVHELPDEHIEQDGTLWKDLVALWQLVGVQAAAALKRDEIKTLQSNLTLMNLYLMKFSSLRNKMSVPV